MFKASKLKSATVTVHGSSGSCLLDSSPSPSLLTCQVARACCLGTLDICASTACLQEDNGNSNQQSLDADSRDEPYITAASTAVVGLSNLGNTCFFNSSVQLLLACAPLQQMLLQHDHHIAKGPLGYALQQAAMFANGERVAQILQCTAHF
jgi:hypothetical protein